MIIDAYQSNRRKLYIEETRNIKDRTTHNSIAAYRHIISQIEFIYEIPENVREITYDGGKKEKEGLAKLLG